MSYIINKTSGTVLTIVQDATINRTTSLTFIGRNFAGYGEALEENFVGLLENFNNNTPPKNPVQGQLWFNYQTKQLNVSSDGLTNWKGIGSVTVGSTATSNTSPSDGDLWWNNGALYGYDQLNGYVTIGPASGNNFSSWQFGREQQTGGSTPVPCIRGYSGTLPIVVMSNSRFIPASYNTANQADLGPGIAANTFTVVAKGITLPGADPVTGSTLGSGFYFWGTAAESISSNKSNLTAAVSVATNNYIPFASTSTGSTQLLTSQSFFYNNGVLNATATAAYYADLAERYEADAEYGEGTVLVIGGEKEVTVTTTFADTRVAGIVSKNPAYMMNKDAGPDETHPYIALKGRVPCKVQGYIKKGDLIVTSSTPGYGIAASNVFGGAIIGKALGTQSEGFGVIEVLVV